MQKNRNRKSRILLVCFCLTGIFLITSCSASDSEKSEIPSETSGQVSDTTDMLISEKPITALDAITFSFTGDDTASTITADFSIPMSLENGEEIYWSSSDKKILELDEDKVHITKPEEGYIYATLTAKLSDGTRKAFSFRILSENYYGFANDYVKAGDTLKAYGYREGSLYHWKVTSGNTVISSKQGDKTGEFAITEDMQECFISLEVDGKDTVSIYYSKLPVMYLDGGNVDYYDISKNTESIVSVQLQGSPLYETGLYAGNSEIKLRGNSTLERPKRPFKLKLDTKADLLGLGTEDNGTSYKSKHWVLLANDIDHSLLRNKLLYDFSGAIGTEFYFHSANIVLVYNGEYQGVYQLCEHRRVDEGRIEILEDPNDNYQFTDWEGIAGTIAKAIANQESKQDERFAANEKAIEEFSQAIETQMLMDFSWIDTKEFSLPAGNYNGISHEGKTYRIEEYGLQLPTTDGGYLVEMDFYSIGNPALARMETAFGQPLYFSSPEPGEDFENSQKASIVKTLTDTTLFQQAYHLNQSFEYALHSDDFFFRNSDKKYKVTRKGEYDWWSQQFQPSQYSETTYTDAENDNKHYSQMFDMDSLVTNFIFCEYAMNWDSMKNSFFYYKKSGELAKIGPQWDFDWCWGNRNMYAIDTWAPEDWQTTNEWFAHEQYYQTQQWNRMLIRDPYFLMKAYEKYQEIRPTIEDMIKKGGLIDTYEQELRKAGEANDNRWDFSYNNTYYGEAWGGEVKPVVRYPEAVSLLKDFLNTRVRWLDQQFTTVDSLAVSLGYYKASPKLSVLDVQVGKKLVITADVKDTSIQQVTFQCNGTTLKTEKVVNGKAKVTLKTSLLNKDSLNCIEIKGKDASGNYLYQTALSGTQSYNMTVSNYAVFTADGTIQK